MSLISIHEIALTVNVSARELSQTISSCSRVTPSALSFILKTIERLIVMKMKSFLKAILGRAEKKCIVRALSYNALVNELIPPIKMEKLLEFSFLLEKFKKNLIFFS